MKTGIFGVKRPLYGNFCPCTLPFAFFLALNTRPFVPVASSLPEVFSAVLFLEEAGVKELAHQKQLLDEHSS